MVCHVDDLRRTASRIRTAARDVGCTLLYSVKANALPGVLTNLAPFIDGCGVSSLNEARTLDWRSETPAVSTCVPLPSHPATPRIWRTSATP